MLQVRVMDGDLGWIFGAYRCQAKNVHGTGNIEIELKRASRLRFYFVLFLN